MPSVYFTLYYIFFVSFLFWQRERVNSSYISSEPSKCHFFCKLYVYSNVPVLFTHEHNVLSCLSSVASFLWKVVISVSCFKHILFFDSFLIFHILERLSRTIVKFRDTFYLIDSIKTVKDSLITNEFHIV